MHLCPRVEEPAQQRLLAVVFEPTAAEDEAEAAKRQVQSFSSLAPSRLRSAWTVVECPSGWLTMTGCTSTVELEVIRCGPQNPTRCARGCRTSRPPTRLTGAASSYMMPMDEPQDMSPEEQASFIARQARYERTNERTNERTSQPPSPTKVPEGGGGAGARGRDGNSKSAPDGCAEDGRWMVMDGDAAA